jgi:hypothetical protein
MQAKNDITDFLDLFRQACIAGEFIRLTLGKPAKSNVDIQNVYIRPIEIKKQLMLSFVFRHATKDITKNFSIDDAIVQVKSLVGYVFFHAVLFTARNDIQLLFNKKHIPRLLTGKATQSVLRGLSHDRMKKRLIETEGNIWMQKLGITNKKFEVIPKMHDKYRQINKYVELIDPMLDPIKSGSRFDVADMGSGKGYLTFSLYEHLVNNRKMDARIAGVEMRDELVKSCNKIAADTGFKNLTFIKSSIADFKAEGLDMLIALHACDTATDDAIFKGIVSEARYIVVAPCCHKQVRKAMQPPENLEPALKHGIFAERQAELITDALRALMLEKFGYKTKVFEFISTEHTPKNVMITGVKTGKIVNKVALSEQIHALKKIYGIESHYLEELIEGY